MRAGGGYVAALEETGVDPEGEGLVLALQDAIVEAGRVLAQKGKFGRDYPVVRVTNVGSTSRGTYTGLPVDFDLVAETRAPQAEIGRESMRRVAGEILAQAIQGRAFAAYCARVFRAPVEAVCDGAGVRGTESFVVRYSLVGAGVRTPFLDITFGRLPQVTGYEIWMRRYLLGHAPGAAARLRAEVRLAKRALQGVPGLYGSSVHGLRAHAVEQWVIQSRHYRDSGRAVGTFDNALSVIAEEGLDFADFRRRFPVWHPGWWEAEAGMAADRRNVNLLDFLGNGDAALAEEKWRRLSALAAAHVRLMREGRWSLTALLGAAPLWD